MTDDTPELPPIHPKHLARERFGKGALHAAHDITEALAEAGVDDDGVVVLRTTGRATASPSSRHSSTRLSPEAEHGEEPKAP